MQIERYKDGVISVQEITGDLKTVKKKAREYLDTIDKEKAFAFIYGPTSITIGDVARVVETCDIYLPVAYFYDKDEYKLYLK